MKRFFWYPVFRLKRVCPALVIRCSYCAINLLEKSMQSQKRQAFNCSRKEKENVEGNEFHRTWPVYRHEKSDFLWKFDMVQWDESGIQKSARLRCLTKEFIVHKNSSLKLDIYCNRYSIIYKRSTWRVLIGREQLQHKLSCITVTMKGANISISTICARYM